MVYLLLLLAIALLLWFRRFLFCTTKSLHILQLEGYRNSRFLRWALRNLKRSADPLSAKLFSLILIFGLISQSDLILLLLWTASGILLFTRCKREEKKPLVFTNRAKRLFVLSLFTLCFTLILCWYCLILLFTVILLPLFVITHLLLQLAPLNLAFANSLISPVEAAINYRYLLMARKKIARLKPKVIGITGSYGKTSVKHILAEILSARFRVLATPASYNTLMGVCKVINNELKPEHEIFIVEMGAYKRGDIRELCGLTRPSIGILTGIGIQHLERFGSIERIFSAKRELADSLPSDGIAILNNENKYCRSLAESLSVKVIRYGDLGDIFAEDIETGDFGLRFSLDGLKFSTKLLGRHNVSNILAAVSCALELGMELSEIREKVFELSSIPHRLQPIRAGNTLIIDDSYNANPEGAREALSVLSLFGERKILVTPGLIELREREYEENRKFGEESAKVCDFVFLVGPKRTKPILDGLKAEGFLEERIFVVKSLDKAREMLKDIVKPGDAILFENDLPDNYAEDC
jgi:UDP-N-acetylmuramoyl-tripeptide--D-alanyl-D-alanine ligase